MKDLHNSEKSITTFQCLSKEGPERLVSGQSLRKQLTGEKEMVLLAALQNTDASLQVAS